MEAWTHNRHVREELHTQVTHTAFKYADAQIYPYEHHRLFCPQGTIVQSHLLYEDLTIILPTIIQDLTIISPTWIWKHIESHPSGKIYKTAFLFSLGSFKPWNCSWWTYSQFPIWNMQISHDTMAMRMTHDITARHLKLFNARVLLPFQQPTFQQITPSQRLLSCTCSYLFYFSWNFEM